jgi:single-strand DNA-binding protein
MRGVNRVTLVGNLGSDPEVKYMPSGDAVANVSIAVADDYKDDQGKMVEQTEWIRLVAFKKRAELMGEYLKKGSKVYVSGKMKTRKWQDDKGADRYATEVVVNEVQFLSPREDGAPPNQQPVQAQTQSFDEFDDQETPF